MSGLDPRTFCTLVKMTSALAAPNITKKTLGDHHQAFLILKANSFFDGFQSKDL